MCDTSRLASDETAPDAENVYLREGDKKMKNRFLLAEKRSLLRQQQTRVLFGAGGRRAGCLT